MKYFTVIAALLLMGCATETSEKFRELSGEDLTAVKANVDLQQFEQLSFPQDAQYRCPVSLKMLAEQAPGWSGFVYQYGKGNVPLKNNFAKVDESTDESTRMLVCYYGSRTHTVQGIYAMPYPRGVSCEAEGNREAGIFFDCRVPGATPN
jgi:hypothetical protein